MQNCSREFYVDPYSGCAFYVKVNQGHRINISSTFWKLGDAA